MPEIKDKYQEPMEGDPFALGEVVEIKKEDFIEKAPIEDESVSKKQEVLELEKKLVEKKAELSQEAKKTETEIIKEEEVIKQEEKKPEKQIEKEATPAAPKSKLSSKIQNQIKRLKDLDKETQIKELCKLAFSDLDLAVSVAKGLNNAYVLDEFHDALVNELYDKLVEQGELKKL